MARPRTAQEWIHWLEAGGGARRIRLGAALTFTLCLSLIVAWKQFHGPVSEATLVQADLGRQLAEGAGFTTLVNYPQAAAYLKERGVPFDPSRPYPEVYQAPLYPLVIAGALRLLPASFRAALFASAPVPPDGFAADYFLLALNLALFWLALWLTFALGRRLFGAGAGWLAAFGLLGSVPVWQQTVAVNGTVLMMVLALAAFHAWWRAESAPDLRAAAVPLAALGAVCGALFLAEYSAGTLVLVAAAGAGVRFRNAGQGRAIAIVLAGFALVAGPWVARNMAVTGSPVGLSIQNVALKAGDSSAEPADVRAHLTASLPRIDLNKLGNKTLSSIQESLKSRMWSGGALWFSAFFVTGWLYSFRARPVDRLRWLFTISFFVLLAAQAALNSGESDRWVAVWMSPLVIVFGAGFFFVLLGSHSILGAWPRACACGLLVLQALPLLHDALEPRRIHFQYPPYFPTLFQGIRRELEARDAVGSYGLMADVPAGLAWYGHARAWEQPARLRDFYAITVDQPIGELLLTPRTLDRPFFSDLNARSRLPGWPAAPAQHFGDWGEVYAGLLTGALPREFPLAAPQKLAENLYVLMNPALPPLRGK